MSEIKLKQEVIDSIQERIDKECYFVGEEWVISSDETLEIVADVLQKTMEWIIEKLEDKKWGTSEWRDKWRDEIIGECIEAVKEEGGIE